ncbi:hypothetical protein CDAR_570151 [Caerostris darwini]|uniref:Uncharacterized protein n=1 Tax=Caerostris darwini TaxID=1538125 RepID=A0AAV4S201_9ARAC|nr:hypothetical protein CDAR_570151 [Caerostris darwini]
MRSAIRIIANDVAPVDASALQLFHLLGVWFRRFQVVWRRKASDRICVSRNREISHYTGEKERFRTYYCTENAPSSNVVVAPEETENISDYAGEKERFRTYYCTENAPSSNVAVAPEETEN